MKKVLIVDDTKNIRVLLTTCLELRGYEVITSDNGKTALEIIKKERESIDLIFLDIRMPEMNGTEVLKSIRDIEITCPVIIMTAYATVKNAIDCTKLGAVAYLQKPFSPDRVNAVIDEILGLESSGYNSAGEVKNENSYIEKARALISKGNLREAHDILKRALSKNPYNKEIYSLIGEVNEGMNNTEWAKRFQRIAELLDNEDI